jgi:putative phosphoesterase
MKLGVISDTHDFFDPRIPELFKGVDHILHAGDVGSAFITFQLEQIAPVTAVLGNTDSFLSLKQTEVVELDQRKFLVHHIVNPRELGATLHARIARVKPDAVVFGHTHKRFCQIMGGILYFNPGYAGKSRFGMERSVAILQWDKHGIRPEYLPL